MPNNDLYLGARNDFILLSATILVAALSFHTGGLSGAFWFLMGAYTGQGIRLFVYNSQSLKGWIIPLWAFALISPEVRLFCHKDEQ